MDQGAAAVTTIIVGLLLSLIVLGMMGDEPISEDPMPTIKEQGAGRGP